MGRRWGGGVKLAVMCLEGGGGREGMASVGPVWRRGGGGTGGDGGR
jgi:hypothetical protein